MTKSNDRRRLSRALVGAMLGLSVMVSFSATQARAEDDDDVLPDQKIFRNILKGLGLRRDEEGIEYRERSPLVLPPVRSLPPPESRSAAAKSPAWPADPDVKRAKDIKAARSKPNKSPEEEGPLLPSQLNLPNPPSPSRDNQPNRERESGADAAGRPLSPKELGTKGIFSAILNQNKEQYETFSSEPARSSLIEPPPGYRTPSPNQPYGVGKEKWKPGKTDIQEPAR